MNFVLITFSFECVQVFAATYAWQLATHALVFEDENANGNDELNWTWAWFKFPEAVRRRGL